MSILARLQVSVLISAAVLALTQPSLAESSKFFRIGTGGIAGTYYPVGGMIAKAITGVKDDGACQASPQASGECGVSGLIGIPQSSNGSVANVDSITRGTLESGFAQSDVVHWAYTGTGVFDGKGAQNTLRAIANLYPETLHIVAAKGAGISSMKDLVGKRISLDEAGSGTLIDSRLVLGAYGLTDKDIKPEYVKPDLAVSRINSGKLDAFFIIAGYPIASVSRLAADPGAVLVPIDGDEVDQLLSKHSFLVRNVIPADIYPGIGETKTISVGAQWVVSADIEDDKIYQITKALWSKASRTLLDNGHPKGKSIVLENALDGISIPLHPGARRFYSEMGMIR